MIGMNAIGMNVIGVNAIGKNPGGVFFSRVLDGAAE